MSVATSQIVRGLTQSLITILWLIGTDSIFQRRRTTQKENTHCKVTPDHINCCVNSQHWTSQKINHGCPEHTFMSTAQTTKAFSDDVVFSFQAPLICVTSRDELRRHFSWAEVFQTDTDLSVGYTAGQSSLQANYSDCDEISKSNFFRNYVGSHTPECLAAAESCTPTPPDSIPPPTNREESLQRTGSVPGLLCVGLG